MKRKLKRNNFSFKFKVRSFKLISSLFLLVILNFSCEMISKKQETKRSKPETKYACEMFCDSLLFDEPGICPICQMELQDQTKKEETDLNTLVQPTNQAVISSIKTIYPEIKRMPIAFTADGYITYGNSTLNTISSRYSGRIEKLYIKYYFQHFKKGEKLFEIYSPEIVTIQENLIYLLKNDPNSADLINAVKKKLLLLGLTEEQINQIEKTKKAEMLLTVYSPQEGHLYVMNDNQMSITSMQNDLSSPELPIKQGMYIKKDDALFNLVNPEKVWATLRIYSEDVFKVKINQQVELKLQDQDSTIIKGKIDLIEPSLEKNAKNINVRVNIPNPHHHLKMGLLLKAKIVTDTIEGLWIPKTAMLDLGQNKIVWLKTDKAFRAKKIKVGIKLKNWIQVIDGINKEDEIAFDAQYLMDSESFIKIDQ